MATYRQIQERVNTTDAFIPKTCWIAHVTSDFGLTRGAAPNRANASVRKYPCPPEKRPAILAALRHWDMIGSGTEGLI
jgi:hypothetical protein